MKFASLMLRAGLTPRRLGTLRRNLEGYLIISPWLIGFLVFTLGPMVASLVLTFTKYDLISPPQWAGLGNFSRLFRDRLIPIVGYNTAYYVVASVVPRLVLALLMALLLDQKVRGIGFFRAAYYMPSIVPAVANVVIWMWLMQPELGLLNSILRHLGLPGSPWLYHPSTSKLSLALMSLWYFGSQMLVFLAALQGVPTELYEAARVDGAGSLARFFRITVPLITPAIFFNLVVSVIDALQVFTLPFIATGGGPANSTRMAVMYVYEQAFSNQRMGYASLVAWLLFLVVIVFTLIQFRYSRWVYYETDGRK